MSKNEEGHRKMLTNLYIQDKMNSGCIYKFVCNRLLKAI
ncbi:hypothetical protein GTCCBUS3UF5_20260 [Geobacillus thermoleovorans CCB_US3_UF5]|uniref:Uncharacterized protein n=1 Tax=Geobacillus thermoleovorans CCB_US3_UF5 TaxID=1111068 RepID=A0ABM5MHW8_GEOTH|nr:hypothetical protein GTCCBUS3UF5_20260 [Geobacillus thermoleovorans CCB_US3_UF5]GAJ58905.1 hypothetical protein B23_2126 [Geobacillus thermoleovorans B23]